MAAEVQNRGISGPIKRVYVLQNFLKKQKRTMFYLLQLSRNHSSPQKYDMLPRESSDEIVSCSFCFGDESLIVCYTMICVLTALWDFSYGDTKGRCRKIADLVVFKVKRFLSNQTNRTELPICE